MKRALCLLLFPLFANAAEHDHSAHTESPATPAAQPEHDHSAHTTATVDATAASAPSVIVARDESAAMQHARHMNATMHGESLNFFVLGERLEQTDDDSLQWELQGWLGFDRDKLWLKTEGEYATDTHSTERSELQLLYSRAVAPYWDFQTGLRRDDAGTHTRHHAAFGFQGTAPYWFDVDAAAFISESGTLSTRLEVDYDLRFSQQLLLQPRLELDYAFADDQALRVGKGLNEVKVGLRLRYEIRREFAPYVGLEWSRAYGETAELLRAAGAAPEDTRFVAGLRFWY